jgi:N-acetylmuramic acid 6-phosphate etherase
MQETERFSPRYKGLDLWSEEDALAAFWGGQMTALAAVRPALPAIAAAAKAMVERLGGGDGRLIYGGAGASGMLAAQDGVEITPTFGWPEERLLILVAGGDEARLRPMGVREDDAEDGVLAVSVQRIGAADAVVGVAASGTTPYTVALLQGARSAGALTVAIANNPDTPLLQSAAHPILLDTGPEVIAGSTRLGAGTAQKAVLGMLSSLIMMRLGHVVDGFMVSLTADNEKLRGRAARVVAAIAGVDLEAAEGALAKTDGRVKDAVLVALGCSVAEARDRLAAGNGDLRGAMNDLGSER